MKLLSPLLLAFCFSTAFGQTSKPTPDPMAETLRILRESTDRMERKLAELQKETAAEVEKEMAYRALVREVQESTPYIPKPSTSFPRSYASLDFMINSYYPKYFPTSRYYRSYRFYPSYLYPRAYPSYRYYPRRYYPSRTYRRY